MLYNYMQHVQSALQSEVCTCYSEFVLLLL